MHRLLFFDIDGTLAYPGQAPSVSTIAAIQKAKRNGHKVFISTGRTMDSIPPEVAAIGFDGGIFSSGGIIAINNHVVIQHFMQDPIVQKILSVLQRYNVVYTLETADGRFNSENGTDLLKEVDFSSVSKQMHDLTVRVLLDSTAFPLSRYSGQPIHKIAYYSTDHTIVNSLYAELNPIAKIVPFCNIPGFPLASGEISDYSIHKGRALRDICKHLNMHPSDCIAFGDSTNDLEILEAAGIGVAMGNAELALKRSANMVCDSCENDGIAKALYALELI